MNWTDLASLGMWLHRAEPVLPFIAGTVSIVVLFGCAVMSWVAPSEKTDCIFHREVL